MSIHFAYLHKCDNPECVRLVSQLAAFCCSPCASAATDHHEIRAHSFYCNERDRVRRPQVQTGAEWMPSFEAGQVAYEAYCEATGWKSLISGEALPTWTDQAAEIRRAWRAAAHAVLAIDPPPPVELP